MMKRIAPVLLCLLLCLLCMTGAALAEESGCTHENAENNGFSYTNNVWWHFVDCPDCGLINHPVQAEYVSTDADNHSVHCPECGMTWPEGHIRDCGDQDEVGTCVFCGEENVSREPSYHPLTVNQYVDDLSCVWDCACGVYHEEGGHVNWCNNPGYCARCLRPSDECSDFMVWHYQEQVDHDQNYCWSFCDACKQEVWSYPHKSDCTTPENERTKCDRCLAPLEEGINLVDVEHVEGNHNDGSDANGNYWHRFSCSACGLGEGVDAHRPEYTYSQIPGREGEHMATCTICGETYGEGHWGQCGGENNCIRCGAENVEICAHDNHPEDSEVAEFVNEFVHHSHCGICGDDWGEGEHVVYCSDFDSENGVGTCVYCKAENVPGRLEHDRQLIDTDTEHCYFSCACGTINEELSHVVYCDSEDQNSCVACGKNVEADNIVISVTWHHHEVDHDANECWGDCSACGDSWRSLHHFNCDDNEKTNCASCGASADEVNIEGIEHVAFYNDIWWDDAMQCDVHNVGCWHCGETFDTDVHEFVRDAESIGSLDEHRIICTTCGYSWTEGHRGNCGSDDHDAACILCSDEHVNVTWHDNHPENSETAEYINDDVHHSHCVICGDDWGEREHVLYCSDFDFDHGVGTCVICGAENVPGRLEHPWSPVYSNENGCKASCACGQEWGEGNHGVVCTRLDADTLTCDRCGEEITTDRYDVWHDYQHDSTGWNDVLNAEVHVRFCRNCGDEDQHPFRLRYEQWSHEEHRVVCDECGQGWNESHWGLCGGNDEDGTCIYCGAVNVQIGPHVDHLGLTYTQIDGNPDEHLVVCTVCGHEWNGVHSIDCSNIGLCRDCRASNVTGEVNHVRTIWNSDDEYCMVTCVCGEINDEGHHGFDCRKANMGADPICDRCGREVAGLDVWHEFEHRYIRWNDEWNCEEHILGCRNCDFEEDSGHPYSRTAFQHNEHDHYLRCDECGITWLDGHVAQCGSEDTTTCVQCGAVTSMPLHAHDNHPEDSGVAEMLDEYQHQSICDVCGDVLWSEPHIARCGETENIDGQCVGTCIYCGAENVNISFHEQHPNNSEVYEFEDEDAHRAFCSICGDDLGVQLHFLGCSGSQECVVCGAVDVNFAYSDHVIHFADFDENYCYYVCDCGEITYEVWHGVYCNSEDKNTCAECGKNTEIDGINICDIWHDTQPGHDETYCWTQCKACGYMPYFGEHYTGCSDDDDTRCDNCGRTEEDGINLVWRHTALDHEDWDEDGTPMHRQVCRECGYGGEAHETNLDLAFIAVDGDPNEHWVYCAGCEFNWRESHIGECGNENNECMYCGAENVNVSMHHNHPENAEIYVCDNKDGHTVRCSVCGDGIEWGEHVADCADPEHCMYCGAGNVNLRTEHVCQLVDFDAEHCYYECSCGEEAYFWDHVIYCDEDPNTCCGCGKNTEEDGIVISIIWHRDYVDYDENECWDTCENCGDLYRGPHYFSCIDGESQFCAYCEASSEEVIIETFQHADIEFNDFGNGWHDPWCNYCGEQLAEPHEYHLYFEYGGYEQCRVYCDTCGYLTNWGHQGQCGEPNEHTACVRCGADDVRVLDHDGHPEGSEVSEPVNEFVHHSYCGICGDDWGEGDHVLYCSDYDFENETGTCVYCKAEEVSGRLEHDRQLINTDKEHCYFNCACGECPEEYMHVVYCDSENQNTCIMCGKNAETDNIVISVIWHYHEVDYDANECWGVCPACGDSWRNRHHFNCDDPYQNYCASCGAPSDEVIIEDIEHIAFYNDIRWDDAMQCDVHNVGCWHCGEKIGMKDHEFVRVVKSIGNQDEHEVTCGTCGYSWTEGHGGICGSDDNDTTCVLCGDKHVRAYWHDNHPGDAEIGEYEDDLNHHSYCQYCGDDWGVRGHISGCSAPDTCLICHEEGVDANIVEHTVKLTGYDKEHCWFACDCEEPQKEEYLHVVYCDSEDKNTCVMCGKNNDKDEIMISVLWHHDEVDYDADECWGVCSACGISWRHPHYFGCWNKDQQYCNGCGTPAEGLNIERIRHGWLDNEQWWDEETQQEFHAWVCQDCGMSSEAHPADFTFTNRGYYECGVHCNTCGVDMSWGHLGQCGEDSADTTCLRCGGEHVTVYDHTNHVGPFNHVVDEEGMHHSFCEICDEESGAWWPFGQYVDEHTHMMSCEAEECQGFVENHNMISVSEQDVNHVTEEETGKGTWVGCENCRHFIGTFADHTAIQYENNLGGWTFFWRFKNGDSQEDVHYLDENGKLVMVITIQNADGTTVMDFNENDELLRRTFTKPDGTYRAEYDYVSLRTHIVEKGVVTDSTVLKLPAGLKTLSEDAFLNVAAKFIVLPDTLKTVTGHPFSDDAILIAHPGTPAAAWAQNSGYEFIIR